MKNSVICIFTIAVFFTIPARVDAQNCMNWATSISPQWLDGNTSGNANNICGTGIQATTTCTLSNGVYKQALGDVGAKSPTVTGATYTLPGSADRLQICTDFVRNTNYEDVNIVFTSLVMHANFQIGDIDKDSPSSTTSLDQVTITGTDGVNTYYPVITRVESSDPSFLQISGNTASVNSTPGLGGDAATDGLDNRGTIEIDFGIHPINNITIRYDNAPGANNNPGYQAIAIGSVFFSLPSLPVQLSLFSGHRSGNNIVLKWQAEDEQSLTGYEIERNVNGNWISIGETAVQNGNSRHQYQYTDLNPSGNTLLYRLKINAASSRVSYSGVIRISQDAGVAGNILLYPNPAVNGVQVSIDMASDQTVSLHVRDISGKLVLSGIRTLYAGKNSFTVDGLQGLSAGHYMVDITNQQGLVLASSKLLKQ